ncbi:MAG TPA: cytochrome c peroxidase [Chitinophagaceae bacterium]|nr:cytochrome c peroxidase [Chitinophagaceae bacterium]
MRKSLAVLMIPVALIIVMISCSKSDENANTGNTNSYPAIEAAFGSNIDPNNLINYAAQSVPGYITKDNARNSPLNNAKATLGRVLFYDKALSIDNSISCASCHKQKFAFSDTALTSKGVEKGVTGRHSMRLINTRFANEQKFFWNERAATLEIQTTMPIQDHAEMGFSGKDGRPGLPALLTKLQNISYYQELFKFVYGDQSITEARMQESLANFVRSIYSFDSKYDQGRAQVPNDQQPFPNFTAQENQGKQLWLAPPQFDAQGVRIGGGLGCNACHNAPEFDIDPNTRNNGIIGTINSNELDLNNTRAPSLRDLVKTDGTLNGPLMHTGVIKTLQAAIGHYGQINLAPGNNNLDPRLRPNGFGQKLNLQAPEVNAVIAFLQTLSGTKVYEDVRWGNPFK